MAIKQGELYWVALGERRGSEPGYRHPHLVIQNNLFNASRINTVVICMLTTNLRRAQAPGNVVLSKGEGNLPRQSVVNISQIYTVDKADLVERIGVISGKRMQEVLAGLALLMEPREV